MKKFLVAAFNISLFGILFLLTLTGIKYLITVSDILASFQRPLVFIGIGAGILLLCALGVGGHIENQGHTVESWLAEKPSSKKRIWVSRFIEWGQAMPLLFGYAAALLFIAPDSISTFFLFLAGMVIRNVFDYFYGKDRTRGESA